jgi:hypothetical protein
MRLLSPPMQPTYMNPKQNLAQVMPIQKNNHVLMARHRQE